ncbi:hypothetical protein C8F01DRAFT_1262689 [Mycena amicta]|nr:hypothetical protein C8F01DRAFT_1262689 [Mycena amicta]
MLLSISTYIFPEKHGDALIDLLGCSQPGVLFSHLRTITHVDLRMAELTAPDFRTLLELLFDDALPSVVEEAAIRVDAYGITFCEVLQALVSQKIRVRAPATRADTTRSLHAPNQNNSHITPSLRRLTVEIDLATAEQKREMKDAKHLHYTFIKTVVRLLRALRNLANTGTSTGLDQVTVQQKWMFRGVPDEWDSRKERDDYKARWVPVSKLVDMFSWEMTPKRFK